MARKAMITSFSISRRANISRIYQRYFPLLIALWVLFVLYPNPLNLIISVQRTFNPDIDPGAVAPILSDLPSNPSVIEETVLEKIPYYYDWEIHSMPWYFPTTEEVLHKGKGDCKARALVLASVFEAEKIPYQLNISPIHVWVDYAGKEETPLENPEVKFYQLDPETGRKLFQIPDIRLREMMDSIWQGFWNPMPGGRKALLFSGLLILIAIRVTSARKGKVKLSSN